MDVAVVFHVKQAAGHPSLRPLRDVSRETSEGSETFLCSTWNTLNPLSRLGLAWFHVKHGHPWEGLREGHFDLFQQLRFPAGG